LIKIIDGDCPELPHWWLGVDGAFLQLAVVHGLCLVVSDASNGLHTRPYACASRTIVIG
jgi:hypothetical protein